MGTNVAELTALLAKKDARIKELEVGCKDHATRFDSQSIR
jgi:hypothetical protein